MIIFEKVCTTYLQRCDLFFGYPDEIIIYDDYAFEFS